MGFKKGGKKNISSLLLNGGSGKVCLVMVGGGVGCMAPFISICKAAG